jgi:DNA primase
MGIATLRRERTLSLPSFSEICARIVSERSLSAAAREAGVKLVRAGREWKACCPFHADRSPSFTIYAGDRRFQCFGCGRQGDVLDFVRESYGVGLHDAIDMLDAGALAALPQPQASSDGRDSADWTEAAAAIWRGAVPITGTPAEAYLRGRGLTLDLPWTLRFARLRPPKGSGVAETSGVDRLPALVALVTDPGGTGLGVQRTFLTDDGRKAAAADGKVKYSLGRVRGGAIQLAPAAAELMVTEGLEDGLTLSQELGRPVWAAAGTSMLFNMAFPEETRSIVIGADDDLPGENAAQKAGQAFVASGRAVRIMRPTPPYKDFNAQLMAAMSEGGR